MGALASAGLLGGHAGSRCVFTGLEGGGLGSDIPHRFEFARYGRRTSNSSRGAQRRLLSRSDGGRVGESCSVIGTYAGLRSVSNGFEGGEVGSGTLRRSEVAKYGRHTSILSRRARQRLQTGAFGRA